MKYAIVTGVSKGLGASIGKFLLESGIHLIGISRTKNEELHIIAGENNVEYEHIPCDLSDLKELETVIEEIKATIFEEELSHVYMVNNAAIVEPIKRAQNIEQQALIKHYHINSLAPMILMNAMIKECTEAKFIGVNITSGAANRAKFGWSAYCSSKASIDMYTKTLALEQTELETQHKIFAFSPGVMDTEMQVQIRNTDPQQFVDVDTFKNYKQQNLLSDTEAVASVLVDIMTDEGNIENGKIYEVRDYF